MGSRKEINLHDLDDDPSRWPKTVKGINLGAPGPNILCRKIDFLNLVNVDGAYIFGHKITKKPLLIPETSANWSVAITDTDMAIGCTIATHKEWRALYKKIRAGKIKTDSQFKETFLFSDRKKAAKRWLPGLLELCKAHAKP